MQSNIDVTWDNRTPVIIGKISPDRANRTPTRNGGAPTWSGLFSIMSRYLPNEKSNFTRCLFTIYLLPFVVLTSREIVSQRRWRRLATEYAGVVVKGPCKWTERSMALSRVIIAHNYVLYPYISPVNNFKRPPQRWNNNSNPAYSLLHPAQQYGQDLDQALLIGAAIVVCQCLASVFEW